MNAKISSLEESEKHWTFKLKEGERNHERVQIKSVSPA